MISNPIVLTTGKWNLLEPKIRADNPPSVWLIRSKMKEVLGFTVRHHNEWIEGKETGSGYLNTTVRLDFYNDHYLTMFVLKYAEYI